GPQSTLLDIPLPHDLALGVRDHQAVVSEVVLAQSGIVSHARLDEIDAVRVWIHVSDRRPRGTAYDDLEPDLRSRLSDGHVEPCQRSPGGSGDRPRAHAKRIPRGWRLGR